MLILQTSCAYSFKMLEKLKIRTKGVATMNNAFKQHYVSKDKQK